MVDARIDELHIFRAVVLEGGLAPTHSRKCTMMDRVQKKPMKKINNEL